MKKTLLIYNPTAGREKAAQRVILARSILLEAGMGVDLFATEKPGDAQKAAAGAHFDYDTIIAAGGDGTLHEVVNGIGLGGSNIKLGIIPAGTSNDFARALRIPTDVRQACRLIASGRVQKTDLGSLNGRLFINIAGGGNLTNISYEVPSRLKTYLGQLAYFAKSFEELPRLKPVRVRLEIPETVLEDDIMLFLTANSHAVGGFDHLAPSASLTDGLLDLIVVKAVSLAEFVPIAARAFIGDHINHPKVTYLQTPWVKVSSLEEVYLNTDGEYAGKLPCTIKVHSRPLNIIAPQ
ncbi:MAG: YegS/Rv2252/BmrU family lipid kinase [Bacillota bacterium]|jgi:diacylglycerol kinase (ATP)